MKRKITSLLFAAGSIFSAVNAQVLSEDFTAPFNVGANGWVVINNSVPTGTSTSWGQGNHNSSSTASLAAFNGATNDFYMADWSCIGGSVAGGISAFLITPTVTITNGAVLQFATTTFSNSTIYPDRLQVLMSQTGNTTIPSGTTSVGSFTDLLFDINPNLTTSTSSAVTSGSIVNGYPQAWTVYQIPITGVTGTVTGRFAFRYFVNNAGLGGANSRLTAIDAVRFSSPCSATVPSYTTCTGQTVTLTATGAAPGATYTWSPTGGNAASATVNPVTSTVYTLSYTEGTVACPGQTAMVTIGSSLSINVSASSQTICSGRTVTLTASGPATTFSWSTGAQSAVTTATPGSTTIYTVGGVSGVFPNICAGGNTIQITVNASPALSVSISQPICLGGNVTFSASGADTYTFLGQSSNPATFTLAAIGATATGGYNFALGGTTTSNNCTSVGLVNFSVNANPTVTASSPTNNACTNSTITITATGAASYSWAGATTSTNNPLNFATGATAGTKVFTITGVDANGCMDTYVFTQSVSVCGTTNTTGISEASGFVETGIFPNPFTNEIRISELKGSVIVYNAVGQVVIATEINYSGSLNTSELPKGLYTVKAYNSNGEEVKTTKLLKN